MISLVLLLGAAILTFLVVIVLGVTFYELVIIRRGQKDERDYTRSYDWTASE
ncbi:MAG: hypothetical protein AAF125_27245 [Chloroflexota bacterium]